MFGVVFGFRFGFLGFGGVFGVGSSGVGWVGLFS